MNRYRNVNFEGVYKVLFLQAMGILRDFGAPDTFDCGLDCQDVISEVFEEFFKSPDGLGWKESKGKLETFLGKVLKNKIIDHLRRHKHVAGSFDDENRTFVKSGQKGVIGKPPQRAKVDYEARLYELVGDDEALRDLIAAAEFTSGGHNVNQELGEYLNKTPHQVSKLKERLLEVDGVKELYAARQTAKPRT